MIRLSATMYGDHQAPMQDEASGVKKKGTLSKNCIGPAEDSCLCFLVSLRSICTIPV